MLWLSRNPRKALDLVTDLMKASGHLVIASEGQPDLEPQRKAVADAMQALLDNILPSKAEFQDLVK